MLRRYRLTVFIINMPTRINETVYEEIKALDAEDAFKIFKMLIENKYNGKPEWSSLSITAIDEVIND